MVGVKLASTFEGDLPILWVRTFHEPYFSASRQEISQITFCALHVCLRTQSKMLVRPEQFAVDVYCRLRVRGVFHVYADDPSFPLGPREDLEMVVISERDPTRPPDRLMFHR